MTTVDHRAEAERKMREHSTYGPPSTVVHLLAAIHDELRAIRRHVVPTPKEPEPSPGVTPSTETERILSALCDQLREESTARLSLLMKAERQAEALGEEVDGLRSERAVDLDTIERLREERDRARSQVRAVEDALGGERA